MAVVILGGIVTSTFLKMIVIPALYLKFGGAEARVKLVVHPFPVPTRSDKPGSAQEC
jgi:hypothetical protein